MRRCSSRGLSLPMTVAGVSKINEVMPPWREMQSPPSSWTQRQAGQMVILKEWRESEIVVSRGETRERVVRQP